MDKHLQTVRYHGSHLSHCRWQGHRVLSDIAQVRLCKQLPKT